MIAVHRRDAAKVAAAVDCSSAKRVFRPAGKHEAKHRAAGLDRWWAVKCSGASSETWSKLEAFLAKRYERIVLQPEVTDPVLREAYLVALRFAHGRFAEATRSMHREMVEEIASKTTHLEAPAEWQRRLQEDNGKEAPGGKEVEEEEAEEEEAAGELDEAEGRQGGGA